jgi:hypothetical protein
MCGVRSVVFPESHGKRARRRRSNANHDRSPVRSLRSGDARRAFSFASDQIRDKFGTPENFIALVRSQYAVVMAPASVVFFEPERVNGAALQPVQMSDDQGQLWLALYSMQLDAEGSWRINGCMLRRLHGSST